MRPRSLDCTIMNVDVPIDHENDGALDNMYKDENFCRRFQCKIWA
jgi:hypothetical protein